MDLQRVRALMDSQGQTVQFTFNVREIIIFYLLVTATVRALKPAFYRVLNVSSIK